MRRGSGRGSVGLENKQTEGRGEDDLDSFVIPPQAQRQTLAVRFISRTFFCRNVEGCLFLDMVGTLSRGGFRATIRTVTPVFANDTHVRINLSMWAIHLTWARANGAPMAPQPASICPLRAHPPEATASVCATPEVEIGRAGPRALVSANRSK